MANSVYSLGAHAPNQPDTLVVFEAFHGAPTAKVPTVNPAGALPLNSYSEIDKGASDPAVALTLTEPGLLGDRIAVRVTNLPAAGGTITATGLVKTLGAASSLLVFEWDGAKWGEVA